MVIHLRTRRNAIIALAAICALVCGGLGWATRTAVQLENIEAKAALDAARLAHERSYDEARALAMGRLDWLVDSKLGDERSRSAAIFRDYYKPARAIDPQSGSDVSVWLPSPLQDLNSPDLLLHFQVSVNLGWSSPQLPSGAESAMPASAIPAADRDRSATPENWLAALRARFDPWSLLALFEHAHEAHIEKNKTFASEFNRTEDGEERDGGSTDRGTAVSRTAAEFARRGARLLEAQRRHLPAEVCEPQLVAMDNLELGEEFIANLDPSTKCVMISTMPMLPVWLDLTMDGQAQLALVRSVSAERSEYCTLQGVLINWNRLVETLEAEVQDLLPGARIEPIPIGTPPEVNMLHTIPAKLISEMPAVSAASLQPNVSWSGLGLAWAVTLSALAAICYGTMKYVTMLERRMRFAAAVTHELRTPLTSFQLYTDLLVDLKDRSTEQTDQYLATLQRESKRLARLVENVLVYSKIGDKNPDLHIKEVVPADLLDGARRQTEAQCRSSSKRLVIDNRCDDEVRIQTDNAFVVQILANLIENACKYSADASDPRIWLTARQTPGGGISLEVEDAGGGVPHRDRKAIFEPFRRSGSLDSARPSGLGLGLALSRYWAECLGGLLQVRRGERNGAHFSRFALCLPESV